MNSPTPPYGQVSVIASLTWWATTALWLALLAIPQAGLAEVGGAMALRIVMLVQVALAVMVVLVQRKRRLGRGARAVTLALLLFSLVRGWSSLSSQQDFDISFRAEGLHMILVGWCLAVPVTWRQIPVRRRSRILNIFLLGSAVALSYNYYLVGKATVFGAQSTGKLWKWELAQVGLLANVLPFVLICVVCLVLAEDRKPGQRQRFRRSLLFLWITCLIAASLARSVYVMAVSGLIMGGAIRFASDRRVGPRTRLAVGILVVALLSAAVGLGVSGAVPFSALPVPEIDALNAGSSRRVEIWLAALNGAWDTPILGHGARASEALAAQYFPAYSHDYAGLFVFPGGIHNAYIAALYDYGVIGLAALLLLLCTILWQLQSLVREPGGVVIVALWTGILARQFFEVQGLMGTASGVADFVTYFVLGVTIARLDGRRSGAVLNSATQGWRHPEAGELSFAHHRG